MLSLVEQRPAAELDRNLQERQRKVDRWLAILAGGGVTIFSLAVVWGIIYKIIILKGDVLEGLLFVGFVLGIIVFALLAIYRDSLIKASARRQMSQATLPPVDTGKLLSESSLEPIPSVTDRTTELLWVENKGSKE